MFHRLATDMNVHPTDNRAEGDSAKGDRHLESFETFT